MSDKARKRSRMYCKRCERPTLHVVYPSAKVCTTCNLPAKGNYRRMKP